MDPSSAAAQPTDPRPESRETMTSERRAKKRRRIASDGDDNPLPSRWRNPGELRIYLSNLLHALRRDRRPSFPGSSAARRSCAVREAADRVLATAARGRTRWSRAILRRTLRIRSAKRRPRVPARSARAEGGAGVAAVDRKAKVLGRLVPGCRRLPFPTLLEETTDYISALEMQVRAMSALAGVLSSSSSSSSSGGGGGGDSYQS